MSKGYIWTQNIPIFPHLSLSASRTLITQNVWLPVSLEVPAFLYYGLLLFIGCYLPAVTILFLKTEALHYSVLHLSYIWLQWPDFNQGNGLSQLQLSRYTEVFL